MECDPTHWLPGSPFRAPEWRWLRARHLHERGGRPDARLDDGWVDRATRFLAATRACDGGQAGWGSDRPDPAIQAALALRQTEPPDRRWRVESYLLTDLPLEEAARRCRLPPATLGAYQQLFFACREQLSATDWIMLRAVGAGPWNHFAGGQLGALWKYTAYTAGPRALEVVIAVTNNEPLPPWVRASFTGNPAYYESRLRLLGKLTLAAMAAQTDAELAPLVEAREQMRGLDRQAGLTRGQDPYRPALGQFLRALGQPRRPAPGTGAPAPSTRGPEDRHQGGAKKSKLNPHQLVAEIVSLGR
jgi:hypothetical protein